MLRYATALDEKNWPALGSCFTLDASARYGSVEVCGGRQGIVDHCRAALEPLDAVQHIAVPCALDVNGDCATGTTYLLALHARRSTDGDESFIVNSAYHDRFERTAGGWRIVERQRLDAIAVQGNPQILGGLTADAYSRTANPHEGTAR